MLTLPLLASPGIYVSSIQVGTHSWYMSQCNLFFRLSVLPLRGGTSDIAWSLLEITVPVPGFYLSSSFSP